LTQEYFFNDNKKGLIKKTNEFYIAEVFTDNVKIDNDEISEYKWCNVKEAIEISEYKNFNETLIEAGEIIKKFLNQI
jgi:isopentenyldiphosphate isomerase